MEDFIGAIGLFAFGLIPKGWMACFGQLLSTQQYSALFSLLGTYYGGDGKVNFALPDLRGRAIVGASPSYPLGQRGGVEQAKIDTGQMPTHYHQLAVSNLVGNSITTPGSVIAAAGTTANLPTAPAIYVPTGNGALAAMGVGSIGSTGRNVAHENMQPFQALNYCICVVGHYPSQH